MKYFLVALLFAMGCASQPEIQKCPPCPSTDTMIEGYFLSPMGVLPGHSVLQKGSLDNLKEEEEREPEVEKEWEEEKYKL